jgi:signal transduction histidine kinase
MISVEAQTVVAVVVASIVIALLAGALMWKAETSHSGEDVADAIAASLDNGTDANALLSTFASAGTIRSATLYDRSGTSIAHAGADTPITALVCRSLANGGSLCIEPPAARRSALQQRIALIAIASIVIGIVFGFIGWMVVRARLRGVRDSIAEAMRDPDYARRIRAQHGALRPVTESVNQLLDQVQTRDVTLRRRTLELETANKDLEAFAYAVSHDLRAPLGSIVGFAQALDETNADALDDGGRECVFWIRESARQMGQLIEGLLQMARFASAEVKRGDVNLSEIARGIAASLQRANPDRNVVFEIPDHLVANGDERLLRALLENLMSNAWKFTSKRPDARIEIGVRHEDGLPTFFVRDNGAGFDPAHAAKMFRPFQRLHSDKEFAGTGIGLATVQKIVQRHGGRAWAEGEPQRGATIYFTV